MMADDHDETQDAHPMPLLVASPDFWWMNETDRAIAFEARAKAYGGLGYGFNPTGGYQQER